MIGMGDHPRVCGEHEQCAPPVVVLVGSSPRMRGTLRRAFRKFRRLGIIPAYAGNTMMTPRLTTATWDHPRVCGEHDPLVPSVCDVLGSSPRMRGTLGRRVVGLCLVGIIPAYAGNTTARNASTKAKRDHPRICGEHFAWDSTTDFDSGSSPHMRGTHPTLDIMPGDRRIIPAYAGNTRDVSTRNGGPRDHPRICGEHNAVPLTDASASGSSPHMRGTLADQPQATPVDGIIPAYAGNTQHSTSKPSPPRDHPRICGEHLDRQLRYVATLGSSPHMRGTHAQ